MNRRRNGDVVTSAGDYTLLEPGTSVSIDLGLGCPTIKIGAALSSQVGVVKGELPPGGGFQIPHWHEDLDEVFFVLEGEIEYLLDRVWRRAVGGSTVFVPAGTAHAFRNATSDRSGRQLVVGPVEVTELIAEQGASARAVGGRPRTLSLAPRQATGREQGCKEWRANDDRDRTNHREVGGRKGRAPGPDWGEVHNRRRRPASGSRWWSIRSRPARWQRRCIDMPARTSTALCSRAEWEPSWAIRSSTPMPGAWFSSPAASGTPSGTPAIGPPESSN